ncbi:MAG: dethiobiotin synthase [Gemmatimonadales bacterium]
MIRLGVTGTDTGVGKTVVTCALAAALVRRGLNVAAMKPVETGVAFDDPARDGARLVRAANRSRALAVAAPYVFRHPLAPTVAARREGRQLTVGELDAAVEQGGRGADALIIEGAGGLLVPVVDRLAFDALFARWQLDVVIVAANRLGVINHTRLTIAAARAAGLAVGSVVLNQVERQPDGSAAENARVIADLERVRVVELPWLADAGDLDRAADAAERAGLVDLVAATLPVSSAPHR